MDSLHTVARRFDDEAARLGDAAARLRPARLAPADLGADAPGRLGELGRGLHTRWATALDARVREALAVAADLTDTATAVRAAALGYADTDHSARRRSPEGS